MKRIVTAAAAMLLILTSCGNTLTADTGVFEVTGEMELQYAEQFRVEHCSGGYELITIGDDRFLLVPEGKEIPADTAGAAVIKQPLDSIYLASSAAMDLFGCIGELDRVKMTSTDKKSWTLPYVCDALDSGAMSYIGKYSAPDYEQLAEQSCDIAIENTMIYHSPAVREQIESMDIPVLVERSSYESHPLGRMEWIKLYGLLAGDEENAERCFADKTRAFSELETDDIPDGERPAAAFFYISSNGYVNIHKPGDYVARMIELAGGKYAFTAADLNVEDNVLSTMNIQLEKFYELAKDADVLIYNSTIDGELNTIDELIAKSTILADFKAVKNGNVWCTGQNMFQQTTGAADMITDLNRIFTGESVSELTYLHRLD